MPTQTGTTGNDYLPGTTGADTLIGLTGNDTYIVDDPADVIVEGIFEGTDTVYASVDYTLGVDAEVEILAARDNSLSTALSLTGNQFNNILLGNNGANILDGGDSADIMYGYGGDDIYYADGTGDRAVEAAGGGNDILYTSSNYVLAAGTSVETVAARDAASVSALILLGNELANTIVGNAGNNYLDGRAGTDVLRGLGGDDIYLADQIADVVEELAGGGNDIVYATGSFTLGAGSSVETIAVQSNSSTNTLVLTGNELANTILGNNGTNTLDGGAGADILAGYGGNDSYIVDNGGDVVVEDTNGGSDTIFTSISWQLGAGLSVERLAAVDNQATTALSLVGNELANTIEGNAGANFIDGGGGADVMAGFLGDDIYIIDNAGDQVQEANTALQPGPSLDIVYVTLSYSGSGSNVELVAAIDASATNNIDIRWEGAGVDIQGNNGNNVLDAALGRGSVLTGFGGADTFVTHGGGGPDNLLLISDFVSGTDKVRITELSNAPAAGALDPNVFVVGAAALDADDRFVYNPATGLLAFDQDGSGPLGLSYVAQFFPGTTLAATDIIIA
jgi:Ca2+-binding RTX toxin-like protein